MLSATASTAIDLYQRHVSPYKGFCCAYRVHTGRRSCSAYAKAVVNRLGVFALLEAMPRQFTRCKSAYAALKRQPAASRSDENRKKKEKWWHNCDCNPCDCVDLP
ncbi:membrane protein insertion efficiency factor YidD, partial [Aquabacterium sp.]|uniref:membrane protein insertion efficiency factor YidD n=1 Tax=Aquabacterium sp. TaxID=1872578 RepID=UPI002CC16571